MTEAFADILDEEGSNESNDTETVLDSHVAADGVRSTLPETDTLLNQDRYEDPDGDGAADDVDSRKLFRTPTLNELRYYAREGPYGHAIITKPFEDAFKHGFEVVGDNTERSNGSGMIQDFLDEYVKVYKEAEKKARRDGHCVLYHQFADAADDAGYPIESPANHEGFKVYTIDNLSDDLSDSKVADKTDYAMDQIYVSEGKANGGVAIVDDISHPDDGEVIGFGIEPRQDSEDVQEVAFVHADRCQHLVWNEHVDGRVGNNVTGKHVGESVLTPVLQPLKGAQMGYWAMMNILHRYSAPLHAVEPPDSWGMDDWKDAQGELDDLSMASDAMLPPGSELSVADGVSEFDPEPVYSVLVESICAGTIFTKSVLQGTQTGTVSGAETDLKGYFNGVHLLRSERITNKFREAIKLVSQYDQETIPRIADVDNVDFEWGELLKPTDIEQAEGAVSLITAATNGVKNYILTPDEARSLVSEEWAKFDLNVDFDDLTESQMDNLDRINMNEAGQGASDNDPGSTPRNNPRMKNGGGQPEGQTRESSQPTRDSLDGLTTEQLQAELARRTDE